MDVRYLVYCLMDEMGHAEHHLLIDLQGVLPSIEGLLGIFEDNLRNVPPAFVKQAEVVVTLEEEATQLLHECTLEDLVNDWDEEEKGEFDIIDRMTGELFSVDASIALLTGEDLARLGVVPETDYIWSPYEVQLSFKASAGIPEVIMRPTVMAQSKRVSRATTAYEAIQVLPWVRTRELLREFCAGRI